jgi:hypothetical protein
VFADDLIGAAAVGGRAGVVNGVDAAQDADGFLRQQLGVAGADADGVEATGGKGGG